MSDDKLNLIRELVKSRMKNVSYLVEFLYEIDQMSYNELYSLPDSSIVDIVESYKKFKSMGLSDIEAFNRIEDIRSTLAGRCKLPTPLTLNNYIKCRLNHDLDFFSIGFPARNSFNDEYFDKSIEKVLAFFK